LLIQDPYYYSGIPTFLSAEIWNMDLQCVFCYCYSLVLASYTVIIFTSIKIYKYLGNARQLPPEIMDIHRQITMTLMVQAIAPIIVCLLPIVLVVTGCIFYLNIPGAGMIINFLFAWIPLTNSSITIIAIRTYR